MLVWKDGRQAFDPAEAGVDEKVYLGAYQWSVFWRDRSSLGDRINVSFIGILTAVAHQIVVSDISPHIAYMTLMHGFLNLSLIIMCATVVINLIVGKLDQAGKVEAGDRLDRRCRWIFPFAYFGLNLVMVGIAFVVF